ncbi:MAG TPA: hypothetical protein VH331_03255 [Allosphingosinicella sp.]|nr:hypothetical protein [Allosphingosinicella sp.]
MKLSLALLAIPLLLPAAADAANAPGAKTTISLVVYGDDPCPKGNGDEIVVCARRPDNERYRIPKELRKKAEDHRQTESSWTSRVAALEDEQRFTRPDSCSPVGSYGQTGCFAQMLSQWHAARRQAQTEADSVP